ncbi:hypothetical protein Tco_0729560 [Tanacetum coccineum]|uniref:Reverse transcriptase domain-containing protein n=1 Tax=Tanacetum coccineum TaxID=301880 RepID=A0ABQ4YP73_9ASTR
MSMLEDHSSYIKVSEFAQDTDVGGKLIQLMHTTMVPDKSRKEKESSWSKVSRLEDMRVIFSMEAPWMSFYYVVFVLVRNIVLTHHRSVTTSLWEVPKMKKQTMPTEVIVEEDREETTTNEHVNAVFTWSSLTYDLPFNLNAKTTIIHDDSEDEADEAEKERLRKEKMEEQYAKFIDLIKEVRINIPLIDDLAGMPNYETFLKDLVSNKRKMAQISTAFLNEECSAIVENKLPPKLGNPGSFLIPCTIAGLVEYLALANLSASINLMPYSLYAHLSGNTLKPTRMNKVTEEELNALLDDSKPSSTTSEKISESFLDHEFEEFMADEIKEIPEKKEEFENSFEVLPLEGNQRIKNSILDPPTNLVMKPLPEHLEYAFLEKDSLPPVVISTLLQDDEKKHLVSILKETQRSICLENIRYSRNYPIFLQTQNQLRGRC